MQKWTWIEAVKKTWELIADLTEWHSTTVVNGEKKDFCSEFDM